DYHEGLRLVKKLPLAERFNAVIVDAKEVGIRALELLGNIHDFDTHLSLIVITNSADYSIRQALSSINSQCVVKTDHCAMFLWHVVKTSLTRNTKIHGLLPTKRRIYHYYPFIKKRRLDINN